MIFPFDRSGLVFSCTGIQTALNLFVSTFTEYIPDPFSNPMFPPALRLFFSINHNRIVCRRTPEIRAELSLILPGSGIDKERFSFPGKFETESVAVRMPGHVCRSNLPRIEYELQILVLKRIIPGNRECLLILRPDMKFLIQRFQNAGKRPRHIISCIVE